MNWHDFREYVRNKDKFTVNEDGTIDANTIAFELSGDGYEPTKYVTLSVEEALYVAMYQIIIEHYPTQKELAENMGNSLDNAIDYFNRVIARLPYLSNFKLKTTDTSIEIMYNDEKYSLKNAYSEEADEHKTFNFASIYDIYIDDDMFVIWTKPDETSMICSLSTNGRLVFDSIDRSTKIGHHNESVIAVKYYDEFENIKNTVYNASEYRQVAYGFSSCKKAENYDATAAKVLSYLRAIENKTSYETISLNRMINGREALLNNYMRNIATAKKIQNKIQKANARSKEFIVGLVDELYCESNVDYGDKYKTMANKLIDTWNNNKS